MDGIIYLVNSRGIYSLEPSSLHPYQITR